MNSSFTEMEHPSKFVSDKAETKYWMEFAHSMHQKKNEIERELLEYQENSQFLEKELETSFEQSNKKNKELCQQNYKLSHENQYLKHKLNEQMEAYTLLLSQMQQLKNTNDELVKTVRKLEQTNDDLERANRTTEGSRELLESELNSALEKVALLETEVEEKEGFKILIQRLKDENKDLKDQIQADHLVAEKSVVAKKINNACGLCRFNSIRSKTCSHTLPNRRLSLFEKPTHDHGQLQNSSYLKYVQELPEKADNLQLAPLANTMMEEDTNESFGVANTVMEEDINESFSVENSDENNLNRTNDALLVKLDNIATPEELEVRKHSSKNKTIDKSHPYRKEDRRNSSASNLGSHIEHEKKRQQLLTFFKKLRPQHPIWIRKKEGKN